MNIVIGNLMNIVIGSLIVIGALIFIVRAGIDIIYILTPNCDALGIEEDLNGSEEDLEENELDSEPEDEPSFRDKNSFGISRWH